MLKVTLEINTNVESNIMTPNSLPPQPRSLSIGTTNCVVK